MRFKVFLLGILLDTQKSYQEVQTPVCPFPMKDKISRSLLYNRGTISQQWGMNLGILLLTTDFIRIAPVFPPMSPLFWSGIQSGTPHYSARKRVLNRRFYSTTHHKLTSVSTDRHRHHGFQQLPSVPLCGWASPSPEGPFHCSPSCTVP